MLPAPIVLPSIHFPDCVGIVVRDLALGWPEDRGSAEEGTAAGPVLCATVVAMAAQGEVVGGERAGAGWREGADERMTVTGRPWWRRGLCPSLCWCFSGVGGLGVSAHAHARDVDWARREVLCACSGGNGIGWPRGRDWEWQRSCGSGPGPPGGFTAATASSSSSSNGRARSRARSRARDRDRHGGTVAEAAGLGGGGGGGCCGLVARWR